MSACACSNATAAQDHIEMLIRGWRRHVDLSGQRFMEVERGEVLALLDEIERLRARDGQA